MAKEHLGRYRNTLHCLSEVLKTEGPSALFIGMAPTLLRCECGLYLSPLLPSILLHGLEGGCVHLCWDVRGLRVQLAASLVSAGGLHSPAAHGPEHWEGAMFLYV